MRAQSCKLRTRPGIADLGRKIKWSLVGRGGWKRVCERTTSLPSFSSLCVSPADGLAAFRAFLKTEFSEENLEFWLACEDFKKTKSSTKIASKARKIYSDFIQADAPKEVKSFFLCVLWVLRIGMKWKVQIQTSRNDRKYNSTWLYLPFSCPLFTR